MPHAEPENPTNAYKEFHAWWEQWRRYRYLASPTVAPGGKPLPLTVSNFYGLPSREGEAEFFPGAKDRIHKTLDTFSPKGRARRRKRGGRDGDAAFWKNSGGWYRVFFSLPIGPGVLTWSHLNAKLMVQVISLLISYARKPFHHLQPPFIASSPYWLSYLLVLAPDWCSLNHWLIQCTRRY